MVDDWPDEAQVLANAGAAYQEMRAQIDHQIKSADTLDTKATALITAIGVVAALVAPRLQLETLLHQLSAAATFILAVTCVVCCLFAIKPRDDFSFGADPNALITDRHAERYPPASYMLGIVSAMVESRKMNAERIADKAGWFTYAIVSLIGLLIAIAWLVSNGGIK